MAINQHFQDELGTSKKEAIARFLEKEMLLAEKIAGSLAADPYVLAAHKNWENLDTRDRAEYIGYLTSRVAHGLGLPTPSVQTQNELFVSKSGHTFGGCFQEHGENGPTLYISTKRFSSSDRICLAITHELTHYRQTSIINGSIKNVDPFIAEKLNWEFQNYIPMEPNIQKHFDQLVERHAYDFAQRLNKKLFSVLEKKEVCLLDRFEENKSQQEYESGNASTDKFNAVQTVDPRHYFKIADRIEDNLGSNQDKDVCSEMIANYELAMRYGEYAYGFNPANAARSLFMLASNNDVPEIYQKKARTALNKYKSHQSTLGSAARMYSKRLDAITAARPINAVVTVDGRRTTAVLTPG